MTVSAPRAGGALAGAGTRFPSLSAPSRAQRARGPLSFAAGGMTYTATDDALHMQPQMALQDYLQAHMADGGVPFQTPGQTRLRSLPPEDAIDDYRRDPEAEARHALIPDMLHNMGDIHRLAPAIAGMAHGMAMSNLATPFLANLATHAVLKGNEALGSRGDEALPSSDQFDFDDYLTESMGGKGNDNYENARDIGELNSPIGIPLNLLRKGAKWLGKASKPIAAVAGATASKKAGSIAQPDAEQQQEERDMNSWYWRERMRRANGYTAKSNPFTGGIR